MLKNNKKYLKDTLLDLIRDLRNSICNSKTNDLDKIEAYLLLENENDLFNAIKENITPYIKNIKKRDKKYFKELYIFDTFMNNKLKQEYIGIFDNMDEEDENCLWEYIDRIVYIIN